MKKLLAVILSSAMLFTAAACSSNDNSDSSADTVTESENSSSTAETETADQTSESISETAAEAAESAKISAANDDVKKTLEETVEKYDFEGVAYAAKGGERLVSYSKGTLENGETITSETPIPIGSVSKQFCAAAVLLLQEQGKLSVDDTLDKYFPEYEDGKKITIKNTLSMRSGIAEMMTEENIDTMFSYDNTEEENTAAIKEWIFGKRLRYEPDTTFEYSNSNYFLLGNIVEQVSGEKYIDFLRENFFEPLGMNNTGSVSELSFSPEWAQGIVYEKIEAQPGLTKGAGDIISSATDMTLWLNALHSGKVISEESFKEMTTDCSPQTHYGYGMYLELNGGIGHPGRIGIYSAFDYLNEDNDFTLFVASNTLNPTTTANFAADLYTGLMK